jgi:hypothetical protein
MCCALIAAVSISSAAFGVSPPTKKKKQKYFKTTVTLTYTDNPAGLDTFAGTVSSSKGSCVGSRRVWIVPETGNIELPPLAKLTAGADGSFTVQAEHEPLRPYYAFVLQKRLSKTKVCRDDLGGRVVTP